MFFFVFSGHSLVHLFPFLKDVFVSFSSDPQCTPWYYVLYAWRQRLTNCARHDLFVCRCNIYDRSSDGRKCNYARHITCKSVERQVSIIILGALLQLPFTCGYYNYYNTRVQQYRNKILDPFLWSCVINCQWSYCSRE